MADSVGLRVTGLREVVRDLQGMGVEVEDLKDAFSKIASEAAQVAAGHAPRRSGVLAASIRGNRAKSKAVVAAGSAGVPYAGPINYGWSARNIQAAAFMQAADKEMAPRAIQLLEDEINAQIRKRGL